MMFDNVYFGILLSLLTFEIGLYIAKRTKISLLNPLLISIGLIIIFLNIFDVDIKMYDKGGRMIASFLGPATVVLAVPLHRQMSLLKRDFIPIMSGIIVGCVTSIISVIMLSKLIGLDENILLSLIPKSVTTPIGMALSEQLGGIPSLTISMIIMTGIIGAVIGPSVCKLVGIKDEIAVGTAMGTSSHAIGTSKAMELGKTQGAFSGLAIGVAGLITVVLVLILMAFI